MKTSPSLLVIALALVATAQSTLAASPYADHSPARVSPARAGTPFAGMEVRSQAAIDGRSDRAAPPPIAEVLATQKMLAQRVVQTYARSGLRVDATGAAERQLATAVGDFSAGLQLLEVSLKGDAPRAGTQDPMRQSIWMLAGQWADARAVIAERPTIHSALRLAGRMDAALATIDRLGVEMADQSQAASTTSVRALLARQAELSQRIARAYWLRRLGDDSTAGRNELDAAERAMRANLAMLMAHPDRDAHDAVALARIETEVDWLLAAIENDSAQSYPLVVSSAVEQVVAQVADFGTSLVARR